MVPDAPRWTLRDLVMSYASRLRFPKLFALITALFLLDLILPDIIPFADEILLGLITLLLGSLRKRRGQEAEPQEVPKRPPPERCRRLVNIICDFLLPSAFVR